MTTLDDFKKQAEPYLNTLVIGDSENVVCITDVIADEDDNYWVFYDSEDGYYYASCLFDWIPLKGFIPQERYDRLVSVWNMNNKQQAV